jgi:hypothetical protein
MKKAAVFLFSLSMLSILVFTGCAKSTAPTPSATPSPGVISVREESVVIGEGTEYELGGTLTIPEGAQAPYPAVLLVHGSGPNDLCQQALQGHSGTSHLKGHRRSPLR